ncbi:MAG: tryptophan synthase subunit alpha [Deltaproteobacteria bacterium]|nr:tryptophan synthase subunit alpha [Deltaproteobacteria bacterium]
MSRLRARFDACRAEGRAALVAYLTFADPDPATTVEIVLAAAAEGADVIELGVPFSDPSADGPVIQAAMERALKAGGSLPGALDAIAAIRARGATVPIVLFGYYNPIFVYGVDRFAARAAAVGVDAVLTVDLPIDELDELRVPLAAHGVDVIPLVAPTSTDARIARVRALDAPFVYYISLTGVTGAGGGGAVDPTRIAAIRAATGSPVAVGFGIKTPADAARVGALADGVVVGSAIVSTIAGAADPAAAVGAFVGALRAGLG